MYDFKRQCFILDCASRTVGWGTRENTRVGGQLKVILQRISHPPSATMAWSLWTLITVQYVNFISLFAALLLADEIEMIHCVIRGRELCYKRGWEIVLIHRNTFWEMHQKREKRIETGRGSAGSKLDVPKYHVIYSKLDISSLICS